uniref:Uncharacterized protein n=2 Tax=Oryza meridionalis TaxID=40149 RepID=A0A0E0EEM6_9ORYZ
MDHGSYCADATAATVCHLHCEISSVKVTGLSCPGGGALIFLRCHVPAGGGRTIQIDSRGADVDGGGGGARSIDASWRDVASLRCDGSPACVREVLDRRSVVFEVRRRRRRRRRRIRDMVLGPAVASEMVGRAEVAWRDVVVAATAAADDDDDDAAVVVERRVELAAGATAPAVMTMSVTMSVRVSETTAVPAAGWSVHPASSAAARRESINAGCEWSAGGEDDVFAMAAACVAGDAFE